MQRYNDNEKMDIPFMSFVKSEQVPLFGAPAGGAGAKLRQFFKVCSDEGAQDAFLFRRGGGLGACEFFHGVVRYAYFVYDDVFAVGFKFVADEFLKGFGERVFAAEHGLQCAVAYSQLACEVGDAPSFFF